MEVGTDEKVCPYFLLVVLFLLSYAFDKYVIVPSGVPLSKEKFG